MGLCRCPKRKVTTQFCYEHRVNVCESCMVEDHTNCIVQGYLQWLKDSDYEPVCGLCRKELIHAECIRLLCYHVFHWRCLDEHLQQLPSTTAPAGYTCPTCGHEVIPRENFASPVASEIRSKISRAQWANGGKIFDESLIDRSTNRLESTANWTPVEDNLQYGDESENITMTRSKQQQQQQFGVAFSSSGIQTARSSSLSSQPLLQREDEDKYKRKSVMELAHRWLQSKMLLGTRRRDSMKSWTAIIIVICVIVFLFLYFTSRYGRSSAHLDPMLDPAFNPNLHLQE